MTTSDEQPLKPSSCKTRMALIFIRSLLRIKNQRPMLKLSNQMLQVKSRKIKIAAYSSMARAVGTRRAWSRALLFKIRRRGARRRSSYRKMKKRVVKRDRGSGEILQVEKLRKLVPGGETMEFSDLLEETAHYMWCLATQVKVMQCVSDHFNSC